MFRVLLLALLALIVYRLLHARRTRPAAASHRRVLAEQHMVRCAHCGVFVPETEAAAGEGGERYCSPAHRSAGPVRRARR